jgi:hypothetical protein
MNRITALLQTHTITWSNRVISQDMYKTNNTLLKTCMEQTHYQHRALRFKCEPYLSAVISANVFGVQVIILFSTMSKLPSYFTLLILNPVSS